jgi:chromate transporter
MRDEAPATAEAATIPHQTLGGLFRRFLGFGFLAWGGPVAQIAMVRRELIEREGWISSARFNRTLAVYQALPGPEAHELCVYFGFLARGRLGGLVAGLGFMLPGFALVLLAAWFYVSVGIDSPLFAAAFAGCQAAVVALILRAVHRIGVHAVTDRWLVAIAAIAFVASLLGIGFAVILLAAGVSYLVMARGQTWIRLAATAALLAMTVLLGASVGGLASVARDERPPVATSLREPTVPEMAVAGLRAGLLTFGGAYTAIPIVQRDAVDEGRWMTTATFLDGVALSGILPAPLIIFVTFIGFVGGGPVGAITMTLGVFAPAFAFTLVGHRHLERLVEHPGAHRFLDGIAAGVVGLIASSAVQLLPAVIRGPASVVILALALAALYLWRSPAVVVAVVLGSAALGIAFFR